MRLAILWQSSGQDSVLPLWELRFDTDLGNQEPTKKIKYKKTTKQREPLPPPKPKQTIKTKLLTRGSFLVFLSFRNPLLVFRRYSEHSVPLVYVFLTYLLRRGEPLVLLFHHLDLQALEQVDFNACTWTLLSFC